MSAKFRHEPTCNYFMGVDCTCGAWEAEWQAKEAAAAAAPSAPWCYCSDCREGRTDPETHLHGSPDVLNRWLPLIEAKLRGRIAQQIERAIEAGMAVSAGKAPIDAWQRGHFAGLADAANFVRKVSE